MPNSYSYKGDNMETITYKVGSVVPDDGEYVCVPCGTKKFMKAGERFGSCLRCFGSEWRIFRKGLEIWEKIHEK